MMGTCPSTMPEESKHSHREKAMLEIEQPSVRLFDVMKETKHHKNHDQQKMKWTKVLGRSIFLLKMAEVDSSNI
jgi:hypothetical protein